MSLSAEEKKKFLKALEEDEEFKFAVAGLLGYKEILERIVELEKGHKDLKASVEELKSGQEELKSSVKELKASVGELERGQKELKTSVEDLKIGQEELKSSVEELKSGQEELKADFKRLERVVNVVAHRFGVLSEESFREGVRYLLEEEFGVAKVSKFIAKDEEGIVYGHPSEVEVDVLIKDGRHILIEIKSRVSKGDVAELQRIGALYEKKVGVKPILTIIGGMIDEGAKKLADKLGVRIIPMY